MTPLPADMKEWSVADLVDRILRLERVVSDQAALLQRQMVELAEQQIRDNKKGRK